MTPQSLPFELSPEPVKRRKGVTRTSVLSAQQEHKLLDRRVSDAVRWLSLYNGPAPTSLELAMWSKHGDWHAHKLNVRIGLSDAKRKGYVENGEKRHCRISHKLALTWRLVSR